MGDDKTPVPNDFMRQAEERAAALKARQEQAPRIPTVQALCLNTTLYSPIQLNPDRDLEALRHLRFGVAQFDAHCVYCEKGATFRTFGDRVPAHAAGVERALFLHHQGDRARLRGLILEDGQFALHVSCSRRPDHLYSFFFSYDEREAILTKVGQTPSLEDVAGADIERYRKLLGKDFSELRKATGLFAHGIGIGSFVYLRRIFEKLVEDARHAADPEGTNEEAFRKLRMSERITALASLLPPALVKYRETYGIMSKGLHELGEEECKTYFPAIRAAVIMMLEQKYEAAEKAKAAAELDRAVAAIAAETKR